jgi:hypothetical protein
MFALGTGFERGRSLMTGANFAHNTLRLFFAGFSDGALSRVANERTKSRITSVFDRSSAAATRTRSWYSSSLIRKRPASMIIEFDPDPADEDADPPPTAKKS